MRLYKRKFITITNSTIVKPEYSKQLTSKPQTGYDPEPVLSISDVSILQLSPQIFLDITRGFLTKNVVSCSLPNSICVQHNVTLIFILTVLRVLYKWVSSTLSKVLSYPLGSPRLKSEYVSSQFKTMYRSQQSETSKIRRTLVFITMLLTCQLLPWTWLLTSVSWRYDVSVNSVSRLLYTFT